MTAHTSKHTHPARTAHDEPQRERHSAEGLYPDRDAGRIAEVSPEGAPAAPVFSAAGIAMLIGISVLVVVAASVATGLIVSASAGWSVLVVSLLIAVVVNPVIYAAVLRAKEREQAVGHD